VRIRRDWTPDAGRLWIDWGAHGIAQSMVAALPAAQEKEIADDLTAVLRARAGVSASLVELAETMLVQAGHLLRDDHLLLSVGCRLAADNENLREMLRQIEAKEGSAPGAKRLDGETDAVRATSLPVGELLDALRFARRTCPPYQAGGYDRATDVVLARALDGDER